MSNGNHMIDTQDAQEQADYFGRPWNHAEPSNEAESWQGEIRSKESIQRVNGLPANQATNEETPF